MLKYSKVSTRDPEERESGKADGAADASEEDPIANGHTEKPELEDGPRHDQKLDHDQKLELKSIETDPETQLEKIPYPKSVFFIVSNEFCERFSYYGMKTILSIYLTNVLLFSEPDAKIVYHTFNMFTYFFPLFGAILSDSWLGKFRTILYVSIIYAIGNIVLALAATEPVGLPMTPFSLLGLILISIGTGGIKPCVSAFGGDQFVLPQQEAQLVVFFSVFYFAINSGSLISTFLTPVLRQSVHCFGNDTCYPVAFAVPGVLMIVSILIFAAGRPLYRVRKPEGNIIVKIAKCMGHAIKKKYKSEGKKKEHWLDYAEDAYGSKLIKEIKITLKVLVLYIPLPIFWALYDQQGSGWTFQAVRMNGDIGFYTILPDQMQVVNPILILIFIPLFTYVIYPTFAKCNFLKTPLQKMVCGGFLTAAAFAISAGVSMALEATYPVLPSEGNAQLRLYNPLQCNATIESVVFPEGHKDFRSMSYLKTTVKMKGQQSYAYTITGCDGAIANATGTIVLKEKTATGYFVTTEGFLAFKDNPDKDSDGLPLVRTLVDRNADDLTIEYLDGKDVELSVGAVNHTLYSIDPGTYKIRGSDTKLEFNLGGVYTVLVTTDDANQVTDVKLHQITAPNSVHMLWLLPQYFVITAGEILFSITGLEFSYSQAPVSMKSVLTAAFLLTTAVGNLIIVIIESAKIFEEQSSDFFLYAGLMVADMLVFMWMTTRYRYIDKDEISETEELDERPSTKGEDNPVFKNNNEEF